MDDNVKLAIAWATLVSFRENLPSYLKEPDVAEYHSILRMLEESTGHDLSHFRIPDSKVDYEIAGILRGTRRRPTITRYTSDKRCDHHYMKLQLDALISFFQSMQPPQREPVRIGFATKQ